jgi:hypothetical protein
MSIGVKRHIEQGIATPYKAYYSINSWKISLLQMACLRQCHCNSGMFAWPRLITFVPHEINVLFVYVPEFHAAGQLTRIAASTSSRLKNIFLPAL